MKVLLFLTARHGVGKRLKRILGWTLTTTKIQAFSTVESLSDRLLRPKGDLDAAILVAKDKEELGQLLSLRDLLEGLRIILVLLNSDAEAVSQAHILRPRFLTGPDSGFVDVAAVLNKMLEASR